MSGALFETSETYTDPVLWQAWKFYGFSSPINTTILLMWMTGSFTTTNAKSNLSTTSIFPIVHSVSTVIVLFLLDYYAPSSSVSAGVHLHLNLGQNTSRPALSLRHLAHNTVLLHTHCTPWNPCCSLVLCPLTLLLMAGLHPCPITSAVYCGDEGYGWTDFHLPPYTPFTGDNQASKKKNRHQIPTSPLELPLTKLATQHVEVGQRVSEEKSTLQDKPKKSAKRVHVSLTTHTSSTQRLIVSDLATCSPHPKLFW